MGNTSLTRTVSLVALIAALGLATAGRTPAADTPVAAIEVVGSDATARFVPLGVGKSVVIDLPRDIKDVLVADPKIANAVVRSARRAYLIGVAVGQTNIFFFDTAGRQIAGFDIAVKRDLNGVRAAFKQALPASDIQVEAVGDGILITGNAATAAEAQTASDIASRLVDDGKKVVNNIVIHNRDQVMLKVTVAEMQRDVVKQLGIDLSGSLNVGTSVLNINTDNNKFSAFGQALGATAFKGSFKSVSATLRAMERAGVVRTLAEPNLTAISGESANFLVGGEFPLPGNYTCDPTTHGCTYGVVYKKFGIGLNFTPVVLSEGRISLKVVSEVSELSNENELVISQGDSTLNIPSIKTRRTETTIEIPSGGSLAMAGLIQEQTKQVINGVPGLMQLPILGTLFKSRDFVNRQTDLAVIVTPYLVRPVPQKNLARPDDGFADASDPATDLLGHLNRIYGVAGTPEPKQPYHGNYGFILD
jgi:pilus assembly protein CpaC